MNTKTQLYLNLLNYLLEFSKLREKTIRKIEEYEDMVWFDEIIKSEGNYCITWNEIDEKERSDWIKIQKPREPLFPNPPVELNMWIKQDTLKNVNSRLELRDSLEINSNRIFLKDYPAINKIYEDYLSEKWQSWARIYKEYIKQTDIYKKFFNIYDKWKKFGEEFEIVVGLGLIYFHTENGSIVRRHILVSSTSLEFDSNRGVFELNIGVEGAKMRVETDMLQGLEEYNFVSIQKEIDKRIEEEELMESPFAEETKSILNNFANLFHTNAKFINSFKPPIELTDIPNIFYAPALILRKRNLRGFSNLYQNIINSIQENSSLEIPLFDDIVNPGESEYAHQINDINFNEKFEEIYFSKPANEEQMLILEHLQRTNKILVQGPPGTGKSHTIANLVSHLLAHGKRILITAYTKRALTVIKDKLPETIKPLCVNLLGNDKESMDDLEASVTGILSDMNNYNQTKSDRNINDLSQDLSFNRKNKSELENKLMSIKEFDVRKHKPNGKYEGSLMELAMKVKVQENKYSWFLDKISDVQLVDDLVNQCMELKGLREKIDKYNLSELDLCLEYKNELPSASDLKKIKDARNGLSVFREKYKSDISDTLINSFSNMNMNDLKRAQELLENLRVSIISLNDLKMHWLEKAINECENGFLEKWTKMLENTANVVNKIDKNRINLFEREYSIKFPQRITYQQLKTDALVFKKHLEVNKKIRVLKFLNNSEIRERWYLRKEVFVNGSPCDTMDEINLLIEYTELLIDFDTLSKLWEESISESTTLTNIFIKFELYYKELNKLIESIIFKIETVKLLKDEFNIHMIKGDLKEIKEISLSLKYHELNKDFIEISEIKKEYIKELQLFLQINNVHPIFNDILNIIIDENIDDYLIVLEKYKAKLNEFNDYLLYKDTLNSLRQNLPHLVEQIEKNQFKIDSIERGDIQDTLLWSNCNEYINNILNNSSEDEIREKLQYYENKIPENISDLASLKAWKFLHEILEKQPRLKMHLLAWYKAIKRIPKTTKSKKAWRFRKEAQFQMDHCKGAIPAWIMPLYRVADTISPQLGMFDYVIIDEASQASADALFLFFIAKKIIIVGDDKQTAPEYVGVSDIAVTQLIEKHLKDIPFKNLFGIEFSFYDHAERLIQANGGKVILREHFRCMPEIIEFSNKLFYKPFNNALYPLKQYSEKRLEPINTVKILNGFVDGNVSIINVPEAEVITDTVVKCVNNPLYKDKTFGIISLRGEAQAYKIQKMLYDRIGPEQYEKRMIVCGSSANFQGDERDIIFLSLVIANNKPFRALTSPADERRFNVAASRAKEQVWLFHSVDLEDISKSDLRYKLLDYYLNPAAINPSTALNLPNKIDYNKQLPKPFGSWFEVEICKRIFDKGFLEIIPQYKVGNYSIDLVVVLPNGSKITVECDGDQFHGIDMFDNDNHRQKVLERCGWEFFRIRGCEYYSNPINSLNKLWQILEEHMQYKITVEPINTIIERTHNIPTEINEPPAQDLEKLFKNLSSEMLFTLSNDKLLESFDASFVYGMGLKRQRNALPDNNELKRLLDIFKKLNIKI